MEELKNKDYTNSEMMDRIIDFRERINLIKSYYNISEVEVNDYKKVKKAFEKAQESYNGMIDKVNK